LRGRPRLPFFDGLTSASLGFSLVKIPRWAVVKNRLFALVKNALVKNPYRLISKGFEFSPTAGGVFSPTPDFSPEGFSSAPAATISTLISVEGNDFYRAATGKAIKQFSRWRES
jgi:hypothetical protein